MFWIREAALRIHENNSRLGPSPVTLSELRTHLQDHPGCTIHGLRAEAAGKQKTCTSLPSPLHTSFSWAWVSPPRSPSPCQGPSSLPISWEE